MLKPCAHAGCDKIIESQLAVFCDEHESNYPESGKPLRKEIWLLIETLPHNQVSGNNPDGEFCELVVFATILHQENPPQAMSVYADHNMFYVLGPFDNRSAAIKRFDACTEFDHGENALVFWP